MDMNVAEEVIATERLKAGCNAASNFLSSELQKRLSRLSD